MRTTSGWRAVQNMTSLKWTKQSNKLFKENAQMAIWFIKDVQHLNNSINMKKLKWATMWPVMGWVPSKREEACVGCVAACGRVGPVTQPGDTRWRGRGVLGLLVQHKCLLSPSEFLECKENIYRAFERPWATLQHSYVHWSWRPVNNRREEIKQGLTAY